MEIIPTELFKTQSHRAQVMKTAVAVVLGRRTSGLTAQDVF